jgi:uncharacterized Fe-S radical SAM superfamily protein PflX
VCLGSVGRRRVRRREGEERGGCAICMRGRGVDRGRQREGLCALKKRETIDSDKSGDIMNKENDCGRLAGTCSTMFLSWSCVHTGMS